MTPVMIVFANNSMKGLKMFPNYGTFNALSLGNYGAATVACK